MVDVLVMVKDPVRHLDPPRETVVPVEEQCFEPGKVCWKPIACIKAAVVLELPFTWMIEKARFGLRQEDKIRLREMYGEPPHPSPAATPSPQGEGFAGECGRQGAVPTDEGADGRRPMTAPTDGGTDCHGPQAALAMTDEREEETA